MTPKGEKVLEVAHIGRREDTADYLQRTPMDSPLGAAKTISPRLLNFPDGKEVIVVDELRARSTIQKPAEAVQQREFSFKNSSSTCAAPVEESDGRVRVLGLEAVKVSYIHKDDPLTRDTGVRLPDYACFEVERTEDHRATLTSPWQTVMGMRTESFDPISPTVAMLSGFDTYDELKPSDMWHTYAVKDGLSYQECPKCYTGAPIEDRRYLKLHK
jgi:hypothetical protein